jgi:hypothetical protein
MKPFEIVGRTRPILLVALIIGVIAATLAPTASAAHFSQSAKVALIPNDGSGSNGGTMPTTGTVAGQDGESFDQFAFTEVALDQVDGPTLAQYDTVVLMEVQTSDLSDAAKQALSEFVTNGGKLIIHDADATVGNDYSWLPVPATTGQSCQNCGATSGTSQVIENNTLVSANSADASYVNVGELEGGATDAVGDANVMVTQDPRWFVDIQATNSVGDTGAVHTYASDNGLIVFNGYDTDSVGSTGDSGVDWLSKLWYLELAQGWSPDGLPHGTPVAPVLPPPSRACALVHGNLLKRFIASLKCSALQTYLEAKCAFQIAGIVFPPLKGLKFAKTAKGLYDLRKVSKKYRPLAKFVNDLKSIKLSQHAPKGFRTSGEVYTKLKKAKHAKDVIVIAIELGRHISKKDYARIARDIAELAGLKACIQGLANAVA